MQNILELNLQLMSKLTLQILIISLIFMLVFLLISVLFIVILIFDKKIWLKNQDILRKEKLLLNATIVASEQERLKLANNLHDDLGMLIHTLKLKLELCKHEISNHGLRLNEIDQSIFLFYKINLSLRKLYSEILPPPLINLGLVQGCHFMAEEINETGICMVDIINNKWQEFPLQQNQHLFYIIKELINNSVKHSKSSQTTIEFQDEKKQAFIKIKSNARGLSNEEVNEILKTSDRFGLKGVFGRALISKSNIDFSNNENNQSVIRITIPKYE